ncbi:MAG: RNA polymerase sigma factor, partial [Clostridia bacterium]|nr:RNA polymerase sigma factor [Clostridia bacterium]
MEDKKIVALFWARDETAIEETRGKYEPLLHTLCGRILKSKEDAEECVNDAYLKAWESIPPQRPENLLAYLAKITRRTAIDRYRRRYAEKRLANEYGVALSELEECISHGKTTEDEVERSALEQTINAFVHTLSPEKQRIFICRYFFLKPIETVAADCHISTAKTKTTLFR